jgi:hypothetical protein
VADLHYHGTHVGATVASNAIVAAGVTSRTTLMGSLYLQFRTIIQPFVHPLTAAPCFLRPPDRGSTRLLMEDRVPKVSFGCDGQIGRGLGLSRQLLSSSPGDAEDIAFLETRRSKRKRTRRKT